MYDKDGRRIVAVKDSDRLIPCTCDWPNKILRNWSGHDPKCEFHKEFMKSAGKG